MVGDWLRLDRARSAGGVARGRGVALPKRRREWGTAILAELAEVRGRSERWGFALGSVRATLSLRPVGGWPVLSLVAAAVVAAVVTAGRVVGGVMPELDVFAISFGHDQGQDPGSPEPDVVGGRDRVARHDEPGKYVHGCDTGNDDVGELPRASDASVDALPGPAATVLIRPPVDPFVARRFRR